MQLGVCEAHLRFVGRGLLNRVGGTTTALLSLALPLGIRFRSTLARSIRFRLGLLFQAPHGRFDGRQTLLTAFQLLGKLIASATP
ncbi:hypothetical protein OPKNFCMD_6894 [Methylobacterium crusticola]|uniref:Transposase DDE domain-containing protein n=1 Tax=Methylobacterium crusticola TaxID=1697972 RepID=A0ABQ4RAA2_9HYPH|nr:hypothetical protein OPKNFCMD_6894 [Methylobacterium crusticola]